MGKTSSAVKDKWNSKAYDEIKVRVPKGQKEAIQAHAEAHSESLNGFINRAIGDTIRKDEELK
ncbi:MAG: antitoxin [Oscillospiraceae bacterium]|nr:antitoxin [Oscillospiraceae bacterium]